MSNSHEVRVRCPLLMELPPPTAWESQAAEYQSGEDIGSHVTTTPFGVEVIRRRSGHSFIDCLSCCDQNFYALSNLYQHVTIVRFQRTGVEPVPRFVALNLAPGRLAAGLAVRLVPSGPDPSSRFPVRAALTSHGGG